MKERIDRSVATWKSRPAGTVRRSLRSFPQKHRSKRRACWIRIFPPDQVISIPRKSREAPEGLSRDPVQSANVLRNVTSSPSVPFPSWRPSRTLNTEQHLGEGCSGERPTTL